MGICIQQLPVAPIGVTLIASIILGCATSPDEVRPAYVDPIQYDNYNCDQIARSMQHRSRRIASLNGVMREQSSDDSAAVGVSVILFWPAAFAASGGNEQQVAEYSRLLGEYEALHEQSILKNCGDLEVRSPEELIAEQQAREESKEREEQTQQTGRR